MTRTKTQKMRAKLARAEMAKARKPVAKPKKQGRKKKWHFALGTQWGSLSMGSGDKSNQMQTGRSRNLKTEYDTLTMAPQPTTIDRGGPSTKQTIRQKELVQALDVTTAFKCQSWLIQPGLSTTFPWLSQVAKLYQRYKFRYLRFYFRSTVSEFDDVGKRGRTVLCCDYDAMAANCSTLQQAEGINPNCPGLPYQQSSLELNPQRLTPGSEGKFIRTGLPPAGSDLKTYDAGMFMFCSSGLAVNGQAGELFVEYEVDLLDPLLPNTQVPAKAQYVSKGTTSLGALTTGVATQILVDVITEPGDLGLGLQAGGLVMPEGTFQITFNANSTAGTGFIANSVQIRINGATVESINFSFVGTSTFGADKRQLTWMGKCQQNDIVTFFVQGTFSGTGNSIGTWAVALV